MAQDDFAVLVGLGKYPGLSNLDGPENDVDEMFKWLVSPAGGAVPADQIARIVSSNFPPVTTPIDAEPTTVQVEKAFRALQQIAVENAAAGQGERTGRRLYIYLSGHGCAPRFDDAALLTADATKTVPSHVLGKLYADWFLRSNYFEEAVLFMDCCRESYPKTPPHIPPFIDINGAEGVEKSRAFYGFGTKWSRASRERIMDDGKTHGVFTWALVKGLQGAAADADTGQITAMTLGNYLYNNMKSFLKDDDLADPEVPKEPDLEYDTNPNRPLVFATVPVQTYPVTLTLPPAANGKVVQILSSKLKAVETLNAAATDVQVTLKRGTYLAQILELGRQAAFEVTGNGAINVSLA